ncbi:putative DNA-directed RNA polymerase iii 130 kda polypeptide protein [Rosellinia necatrix]|uniref:Putative DNA-directed RNA polymerase iii 130 kDa polypeptide protein n=1 Tax=Rosellinia necatrix TaxID=77044 RepID=A0A1S7UKP8_ROSNE|nr:putative DNA-directed RNA polymerase iii 130 kda polypeptide protein [Rosellinia necatrix]
MSLSNSFSVARASSHVLSPAAPTAALSRVAAPTALSNAKHSSLVISGPLVRAPASLNSTSTTPQPASTQIWFNSTMPRFNPPMPDDKGPTRPETERKVKLGKTLRILQEHLPTLLQSPLPQEILSPNISLHLFPSTHPHLPTVSGKVAYIAALRTSPIAWNRVPIVGNVRLEILSERMVSQPLHFSPRRPGAYGEQLVVKWRTASSSSSSSSEPDAGDPKPSPDERNLDAQLRGSQAVGEKKKAFTGLFVFEFDKDGRIISHTIEHVDEHGDWERGVGARMVGLTDWLLGGIKGRSGDGGGIPALFKVVGDKQAADKGLR